MSLKGRFKSLLFGPPGPRVRRVRAGLLRGLAFRIDTANKAQRLIGFDEREIAGWVRHLTCSAVTALDIGANDGWYSLYFAAQSSVRYVWAFEPQLVWHADLEANFAANNAAFKTKLRIKDQFVGDRDTANTVRLDALQPDLAWPILMKIDVDGGEMDVLRGGRELLGKGQCAVVLETHSAQLEADCAAELASLDYTVRIVPNGWYRLFIPERRPIDHNRWLVAVKNYPGA